jgi:phosphoribosylformylglycinamidine synthase
MDFKEPGNLVLLVGMTRQELGGSLWGATHGQTGGNVPGVDPELGQRVFRAVHLAISHGLVRSCHDLSDGGLAVALAEMAIAGVLGATISLRDVPCEDHAAHDLVLLFSESPSRFLLEVSPRHHDALADLLGTLPWGRLGELVSSMPGRQTTPARLTVTGLDGSVVIEAAVDDLRAAWQQPLHW